MYFLSFLYTLAALLILPNFALACSLPGRPFPAEISALYEIQAQGNTLTSEQNARLDEYEADLARMNAIWSQFNPCPMYPHLVNDLLMMIPGKKEALEKESKMLNQKWYKQKE